MAGGALAAGIALVAAGSLPVSRAEDDGAYVDGSLAWIFSDRLDLIGRMAAEVPLAQTGPWRVFAGVEAVTAIEKATNFTFQVDQVDYAVTLGARRSLGQQRGAVEVFLAEKGRQAVDTFGTARVRIAGAAWESDNFHEVFGDGGWAGRVALAGVFEDRGVDGGATADGSVRWMRRLGGRIAWSAGVEAEAHALFGRDHGVDLLAGPRVDFDLGGDRRFGLSAKWLSSANPLGLETDGLLVGFDFAQGPRRAPRAIPPEIAGLVAAGGGDGGRALARLDVRVATPPFLAGTRGEIEVDGNALTGPDVNDLYYFYDVGVAHPVDGWPVGVWFHHRSDHVLDQINPSVESDNVIEAGIESSGWNRAEPGVDLGRAGAVDLRVRAGWVLDSTFDPDVAWHARGGLRWSSPDWRGVRLYASAEAERGDVAGSRYALGLLLPRGWDTAVEQRHDVALYSGDRRALLGVATLRF